MRVRETERWREKEEGRKRERETDRQTKRQANRQRDRQTEDTQTGRRRQDDRGIQTLRQPK